MFYFILQILTAISVSLVSACVGFISAYTSPAASSLKTDIGITKSEVNIKASKVFFWMVENVSFSNCNFVLDVMDCFVDASVCSSGWFDRRPINRIYR